MTAANQEPAALPMGLRERVMTASRLARGAGQPVPAVPEISGAEAFGRAADAFCRLLSSLGEEDWKKPVLRDLDIQGLVGHLIGVEDDVQRGLAGDPAVADAGHVESTQGAAVRQAGRSRPDPGRMAPRGRPHAGNGARGQSRAGSQGGGARHAASAARAARGPGLRAVGA